MTRRPAETTRAAPVGWLLLASVLASIGLGVVYVRGGHPQLEGALLAVALGGIGIALILWAQRFLPAGPHTEDRPLMRAADEQQRSAEETFERGLAPIERRRFLVRLLGASAAAFAAVVLFPIRSLGPRPGRALLATAWRRGSRVALKDGTLVRAADLAPGTMVVGFPENDLAAADSQIALVRAEPGALQLAPEAAAGAPDGLVAYSRICTHAGCPVGLYEAETHELFCPCHQSVFDVTRGARPTGGPATRPLPQLPIEVDEQGYLRALGDFTEAVGPDFWERT